MSKLKISRYPVHINPTFPLDDSDNYHFITIKHIAGVTNIRHKTECKDSAVHYTVHFTIRLVSGENYNVKLSSVPAMFREQAIKELCGQRDLLIHAIMNWKLPMVGLVSARYRIVEEGEA